MFISLFLFCFVPLYVQGFCFHLKLQYHAERGGFEPPIRFRRIHAFQACLFNHSSISPFHILFVKIECFSSLIFMVHRVFSYKCILFIRLIHLSFRFNFTKRPKLIYFKTFKHFFALFHLFSNTFFAFSVVNFATSSTSRPYTEATCASVYFMKDVSFRFPRQGTGAK